MRAHYRAVEGYVAANYPFLDIDDVVSATFTTAWRRFDDRPEGVERGWLIGIARNMARNDTRALRRRRAANDAVKCMPLRRTSNLHDVSVPTETVERVEAALGRLNVRDREVIELAAFHGLVGADLGAALDISAGAAAVRLHRARKRLEAAYSEVDS